MRKLYLASLCTTCSAMFYSTHFCFALLPSHSFPLRHHPQGFLENRPPQVSTAELFLTLWAGRSHGQEPMPEPPDPAGYQNLPWALGPLLPLSAAPSPSACSAPVSPWPEPLLTKAAWCLGLPGDRAQSLASGGRDGAGEGPEPQLQPTGFQAV